MEGCQMRTIAVGALALASVLAGTLGCSAQGKTSAGDLGNGTGGSSGTGGGGGSGGANVGTSPTSTGTGQNGAAGSSGSVTATNAGSSGAGGTGSSGTGTGSSGSGDAGTGPSSGGGSVDVGPASSAQSCLMAGNGDYSQKGPYTVTKSSVDLASYLSGQATPTTYSLFLPSPLDPKCPAPVVVWGNGTGVTGSSTSTPAGACTGTSTIDCLSGVYDFFNVFAASWGIVVLASDNSNVGSGAYHKAGAQYAMDQNKDPSSPLYQKLSGRIGVSGHSQGGIGATAATTMIGAACQAEVCVAGAGVPLSSTAFICLTGTQDVAESGCQSAYTAAGSTAFFADWDGGTHTGTETLSGYTSGDPGTYAMQHLYAAWFRCFLADDKAACKLFEGGAPKNCGICTEAAKYGPPPGWAELGSRGL